MYIMNSRDSKLSLISVRLYHCYQCLLICCITECLNSDLVRKNKERRIRKYFVFGNKGRELKRNLLNLHHL